MDEEKLKKRIKVNPRTIGSYHCYAMRMDNEKGFGVVDNCVFAGMLVISAVIGLYINLSKESKSPEEFLMGKSFHVSHNFIYQQVTTLIGFPAEVYANGLQISTMALGCPLAIIFSSYFLLPVLYSLKLTSINEYIELRFKSKRLRFVIFLLSMAKALAANGIGLYAPTIALSSVTNLSTLTSIFILGSNLHIYSSFVSIRILYKFIYIILILTKDEYMCKYSEYEDAV
ncbi:hypothetical protein Avbf_18894 [Armadillidium vulgare]|nr:hypothetical protein Avbf_18894 [Armadillidium vulgare]